MRASLTASSTSGPIASPAACAAWAWAPVPVGVFLDSSPKLIVAYLATLKAGGAYVPLGTGYPADRLAFMLAETGAPVVLTRNGLADLLPATGARTVEVDDPSVFSEDAGPLPDTVPGNALAYVIYTSGSTGRPKGVACTHEGVVRLVRESGFCDFVGETFLQITVPTFDVSTFEIWGALLNGGRLAFLATPAPTLEGLGEAIARHRVTTLWLTSGLFGLMVDRRIEDLRPLRQLLAGGDAVPVPQARRVVEELPGVRLIDGYGPTENTTFTACHAVRAEDVYRPSIRRTPGSSSTTRGPGHGHGVAPRQELAQGRRSSMRRSTISPKRPEVSQRVVTRWRAMASPSPSSVGAGVARKASRTLAR